MKKLTALATAGLLTAASTGAMAAQFSSSEEAWGGPAVTPTTYQAPGIQFAQGAELGHEVEVTVKEHQAAGTQFQKFGYL